MNKTILIGRLTKDIEIRKTPNGASVTNFVLAVNRIGKQQAGQPEADWINCVSWNQTADAMAQYLGKGSQIGIEGRIQTRNYDDRETNKKVYVTEVVVERVEFLESRAQRQTQQQSGYYDQSSNNDYNQHQNEPILDIQNDDLPF